MQQIYFQDEGREGPVTEPPIETDPSDSTFTPTDEEEEDEDEFEDDDDDEEVIEEE